MIEINYSKVYDTILKDINNWKRRKLTPIGKITLIKSLFLSKANHLLATLPNPSATFVKKLEKTLFQFVWDNKPEKIKRTTLMNPNILGGLNMPNIHNTIISIKASWLRKLIKATAIWVPLFEQTICNINTFLIYGDIWFFQNFRQNF